MIKLFRFLAICTITLAFAAIASAQRSASSQDHCDRDITQVAASIQEHLWKSRNFRARHMAVLGSGITWADIPEVE
jgi:hypothetical protein